MKTALVLAVGLLLVSSAPGAGADAAHKAAAKEQTLSGELVDTGCYLAHEARGEKHVGCATKCIAQGMPMGLLTSGGTLYLVTMNHDNPDPYNQLKDMAGKNVTITGAVMTRGGIKGIEATSVRAAAAK